MSPNNITSDKDDYASFKNAVLQAITDIALESPDEVSFRTVANHPPRDFEWLYTTEAKDLFERRVASKIFICLKQDIEDVILRLERGDIFLSEYEQTLEKLESAIKFLQSRSSSLFRLDKFIQTHLSDKDRPKLIGLLRTYIENNDKIRYSSNEIPIRQLDINKLSAKELADHTVREIRMHTTLSKKQAEHLIIDQNLKDRICPSLTGLLSDDIMTLVQNLCPALAVAALTVPAYSTLMIPAVSAWFIILIARHSAKQWCNSDENNNKSSGQTKSKTDGLRIFEPHHNLPTDPIEPIKAPSSLGVAIVNNGNEILIRKGAHLPDNRTGPFTTVKDNQESIEFKILCGESPQANKNRVVGIITLDDINPEPAGSPKFEVTFRLGEDGVLKAFAKDLKTGNSQALQIKPFS